MPRSLKPTSADHRSCTHRRGDEHEFGFNAGNSAGHKCCPANRERCRSHTGACVSHASPGDARHEQRTNTNSQLRRTRAVPTVDPVAQAEVLQAYSHYWEQRTLAFRDLDPSLLSTLPQTPSWQD